MIRTLCLLMVLGLAGCGSDGGAPAAGGGASNNQSCPDVSGSWKVAKHCDASLVGMTLDVTATDCALTFAAPFDSFRGSVTTAGAITLSGPQSCTGTATATAVEMTCTPGTCEVVLGR